MSSILNEVAIIKAPRSGEVIHIPVTTTAVVYAIPSTWQGQQCTWSVYPPTGVTTPVNVDVAFGLSGMTIAYGTDSGVGSAPAITISTATGGRVSSAYGGSRHWKIPMITDTITHFAVDGDAVCTLEMIRG